MAHVSRALLNIRDIPVDVVQLYRGQRSRSNRVFHSRSIWQAVNHILRCLTFSSIQATTTHALSQAKSPREHAQINQIMKNGVSYPKGVVEKDQLANASEL